MANHNGNVVMGANEEASRKKGHNIFPKVVSVVLAFILWFYVMNVESPINEKVFRGVPIEVILPTASELSVYSGYNATVDITVSGKRSDLNSLSIDDFHASVDASGYTQANKYSMPVSVEVPGNVTFVDKSISALSVYLDIRATADIPVQIKHTDYTIAKGLELGGDNEIEMSVNTIPVNGPKSVVETIETALVEISYGYEITSSVEASGSVQLIDKNGETVANPYVTTAVDNVNVTVPVFMTKSIDLKIGFKNGLLNDSNSDVQLSPSSVKVRGTKEALESLNEYTIHTIDEKTLDSDNEFKVPLSLPEGVTCVDGVEFVEVSIAHIGTATKSFTVSDIKVTNPGNLEYELSHDTVKVTLRGTTEAISNLNADDISLVIDLSDIDVGVGPITLPLTVKVSGTYSKSVYEIGEYNMVVTVK